MFSCLMYSGSMLFFKFEYILVVLWFFKLEYILVLWFKISFSEQKHRVLVELSVAALRLDTFDMLAGIQWWLKRLLWYIAQKIENTSYITYSMYPCTSLLAPVLCQISLHLFPSTPDDRNSLQTFNHTIKIRRIVYLS